MSQIKLIKVEQTSDNRNVFTVSSPFGERSMALPLTEAEFIDILQRDCHIQDHPLVKLYALDKHEREFFITGTTPEDWLNMIGDEDD